ncbi:chemotaxis protein CheA [Paraconexibacter algicola]|uniref:Chemotaxis protein CheA n=2 Tax=Paraconexibacter algicola TaxID=2133960 RepID=A0A2T4UIU9_9ACTN|nr:chemotaxis protein CheA [Paraconexibacter algicola]
MDMSEYLPMFVAECREHLQELNTAVVTLEERPDDRAVLDEIFRAAHSLKGMSATMGFEGVARLTHQMEDVFELLRQRNATLPAAVVDVLLECLDALEAAIDAIEASGGEQIDPDALISRLAALVREEDVEDPLADPGPRSGPAPAVVPELQDGERLLHVTVTLGPDAMMPAVRAFMVLAAIAEHGEVVSSSPTPDEVDDFAGRTIEATVVCGAEDDALVAACRSVEDVTDVRVEAPVPSAADAQEPAPLELATADGAPAPTPAAAATPTPVAPVAAPTPREAAAAGAQAAAAAAPAKKGATTVRVDAERLDQLMHAMGELVVQRTLVEGLAGEADIPGLTQAMQELTRTSHALQAMVMQIRMIPVEAVFLRFPRLVRDVSSKLGKQVDLDIVGQETELDRTVVDALGDPMVHLIRNALDHGLEGPDERVAAGKPATGTLSITARHAGGSIVIAVSDDGRGIDPQKVGARAVQRGLITAEQAATLDVAGAIELLFAPGFSTAETVGDLSGRGVGMDAVRTKIRALGGEVVLTAVPGQGTSAEIRLPLTLAIMSALLVDCDGLPYGIPLGRVERTMRVQDGIVRSVTGRRMLVLEEEAIPLLRGREVFGHKGDQAADAPEDQHIVLIRAGDRLVALSVGHLIGQTELVTRPLPPGVADAAAVSGAAVLSSGQIVLLADCDALADAAPTSTTTRTQEPLPS